jgi:hypothetical protein
LKQNGRKDAQKSIVFMTDGIVETGNQYNDQHKTQWLKEELAGESQKLGIKIFGIAFTEQADFALIQTLGQKTGGGYYRVLKPEDIQGAFDSIQTTMLSLNTVATTVPNHKDPADASKSSTHFWILVIAGVVIVGITIFWVSRKGSGNQLMSETAAKASSVVIPSARMEDVNGISGQEAFEINKTVITIGRRDDSNFNSGIDIPIPAPGVSALHAVIEYRDHNFYLLIDVVSTGPI